MTDTHESSQEKPMKKSMRINILDMYETRPEDLILDISATHYSNIAYIQVAERDVILDFLALPGTKKEGKTVVNGVRVYMSHVAAQSLVERLGKLIENAYNEGNIAKLDFSRSEDVQLTTEISRPIEEEKT